MKKHFLIFLILCSLMFAVSCSNDKSEPVRTITVTGNSAIFVTPDKATISFSVVSKDKELTVVKAKNDSAVKNISELMDKFEIEKKNISIERINIYPRYSYRNDEPKFMYYEITQNISVGIDDLSGYELFLDGLLKLGIDRIDNIYFSVDDVKKYKNDARIEAVRDAESKAELFCSATTAGDKKLKVGKVLHISEYSNNAANFRGGMLQNYRAKEFDEASAGGVSESSPSGQIKIEAQVEIVFEIQ